MVLTDNCNTKHINALLLLHSHRTFVQDPPSILAIRRQWRSPSLLPLYVWDLPLVVVHRWLLQLLSSERNLHNHSLHIHTNICSLSLHKYQFSVYISLGIQIRVFQHWSERLIPTKFSSVTLNLVPLQCEIITGRNCKGSFITLSRSHWYHWLCRPNPVKLTPCCIKSAHRNT